MTKKMVPVEEIRSHFPALERRHAGQPVAYFDGPGGTQTPRGVAEAMCDYLYHHNANTHWNYPTSAETDAALQHAREAFADLFNAAPNEISFGNNMTTITFHIARAIGRRLGPGDEIVITELDHHGNVAPWTALARERGVTLRKAPFDVKTGELVWDELERLVTDKTRVVAVGAASNALGTISPVRRAAELAHAKGALCFVDAVHFTSHRVVDVKDIGCDFLVCSPYKFYGAHTGALFAKGDVLAALDVPKLEPAPDTIPERAETGTQNHEGIVGAAAAVEFLASLGAGNSRRERLVNTMTALHEEGDRLVARLWEGLHGIRGVRCYGPPPNRPRTPTISFVMEGKPSKQIALALAERGIFASNGGFYALDVVEKLGHRREGMMRVGCACYTTMDEVERLLAELKDIAGR